MVNKLGFVVAVIMGLLLCVVLPVNAGGWHIPLGVTYLSDVDKITDQLKENKKAEGYLVDTVEGFPVGLSIQPYYEFDSGIGIGIGLGPLILTFGDVTFTDIPVNLCLRYAILPKSNITPYVRAGIATHLASGDYVETTQAGFIGAAGVEFMRNRAVQLGIELGVDTSKIEFEDLTSSTPGDTIEIEPMAFMISIFAVF